MPMQNFPVHRYFYWLLNFLFWRQAKGVIPEENLPFRCHLSSFNRALRKHNTNVFNKTLLGNYSLMISLSICNFWQCTDISQSKLVNATLSRWPPNKYEAKIGVIDFARILKVLNKVSDINYVLIYGIKYFLGNFFHPSRNR